MTVVGSVQVRHVGVVEGRREERGTSALWDLRATVFQTFQITFVWNSQKELSVLRLCGLQHSKRFGLIEKEKLSYSWHAIESQCNQLIERRC